MKLTHARLRSGFGIVRAGREIIIFEPDEKEKQGNPTGFHDNLILCELHGRWTVLKLKSHVNDIEVVKEEQVDPYVYSLAYKYFMLDAQRESSLKELTNELKKCNMENSVKD